MKKRSIILFLVIFFTIFLIFIAYKKNKKLPKLNNDDKRIILEHCYINTNNDFIYKSVVLFNDGTIYKIEVKNAVEYSKYSTMRLKNKWIVENGSQIKNIISKDKMNKLNDYIEKLEISELNSKENGSDQGTTIIRLWDFEDEKYIILKETGDYTSLNDENVSKKIIKFAEKYLKL